jgi:hypothetical protein
MEQSVNQNEQKKIVTLEERLRQAYGPVKPAPDFIESLQHHLITPPKVMLENRRNGFIFLIMAFGLVFGVMLFILIRAIYRHINDNA